MALRVVAIAAPDYAEGKEKGQNAIISSDPASLFNACRYAALLADKGEGAWAYSNWAIPRKERREKLLMPHSLKEGTPFIQELLEKERPNLLLIGSMTLCFPGAIASAKLAKDILGEEVCIVLGGRHATETIYLNLENQRVVHHPGSPLRLMAERKIPPVFDLVISGDGEYVIARIGELIDRFDNQNIPVVQIRQSVGELVNTPGKWIAGFVESDRIFAVKGNAGNIDYNHLPPPCSMFGVQTGFDVFEGCLTAHVFSDLGRGCAYDCDFCSERFSVTGPPAQISTSANRLFRQLKGAKTVINEDYPKMGVSAFVEDSVLLGGSNNAIYGLIRQIEKSPLGVRFGAQLTLDQILGRRDLLRDLKNVGLEYLFIGLETFSPVDLGGMSKDVKKKDGTWMSRAERVFSILAELHIKCGVALLFGLGEQQQTRMRLFDEIEKWQKHYGLPYPISLNWAVQHPLNGNDGGTGYTYVEWGTPPGPLLDAFQDFGEASLNYPIAGVDQPALCEVLALKERLSELASHQKIIYRT